MQAFDEDLFFLLVCVFFLTVPQGIVEITSEQKQSWKYFYLSDVWWGAAVESCFGNKGRSQRRQHRPALSCARHSAGVCVCVGVWVCVRRFPRVEGLHWDGLSSFPLIAMQRGPAAYTRLWRLKYLPLCLPGRSWLTGPAPQAPPSLYLQTSPLHLFFSCHSSVWATSQHWLWCFTLVLSIIDSLSDRF